MSSLEQQYNATDILNSFNISLDQMIEDQMTPIKQFGYNVFSTKFNVPISSNHVPKNYLLQKQMTL